jgi:hypothetical protein
LTCPIVSILSPQPPPPNLTYSHPIHSKNIGGVSKFMVVFNCVMYHSSFSSLYASAMEWDAMDEGISDGDASCQKKYETVHVSTLFSNF